MIFKKIMFSLFLVVSLFVSIVPVSAESKSVDTFDFKLPDDAYSYVVRLCRDKVTSSKDKVRYFEYVTSDKPILVAKNDNGKFVVYTTGNSKYYSGIYFIDPYKPELFYGFGGGYSSPEYWNILKTVDFYDSFTANHTVKDTEGNDFFLAPLLTDKLFAPVLTLVQEGMMITVGSMIFLVGLGISLILLVKRFRKFSIS